MTADPPAIPAEVLDALPEGSIVMTYAPCCFVKIGEDTRHLGGDWRSPYKSPGASGEFRDSTWVSRVATRILYNPADHGEVRS